MTEHVLMTRAQEEFVGVLGIVCVILGLLFFVSSFWSDEATIKLVHRFGAAAIGVGFLAGAWFLFGLLA